jgi:hypothetical protein
MRCGELKVRQAAEELGAGRRRRDGRRGKEEVARAGDERVGVVRWRRRPAGRAVARPPGAGRGRGSSSGRGRGPEDGAQLVDPAEAVGVERQRREGARRGGGRQRRRQRRQDARARGSEDRGQGAVVGVRGCEVQRRRLRHRPDGPLDGGEPRGRGHGGGGGERQLRRKERHAVVVRLKKVGLGRRPRLRAGEPLHERHELAGRGVDDLGRRVVDDHRRPRRVLLVPPAPLRPRLRRRRWARGRGLLDGVRLHPHVEPRRARALQLPPRRRGPAAAARRRRRRLVHAPRRVLRRLAVGGGRVRGEEETGAGGVQHQGDALAQWGAREERRGKGERVAVENCKRGRGQ